VNRTTGALAAPPNRGKGDSLLFLVKHVSQKGLQPGRRTFANPSVGFLEKQKKPRRHPSFWTETFVALICGVFAF
jgi:hypothetical protein